MLGDLARRLMKCGFGDSICLGSFAVGEQVRLFMRSCVGDGGRQGGKVTSSKDKLGRGVAA